MGFSCGIVGLPNVGKSTLFNCLGNAVAESANYPFCTIEPNVGIVDVPDERLTKLSDVVNPQKIIPTTMEFVDIAGLVRGASKGEGLGNQFLSHIREVDAIVQVVRCFEDENITHVDDTIDPVRDVETIETELIFKDLETVEKRLDKAKKMSKGNNPIEKKAVPVCESLYEHLSEGKPARSWPMPDEEDKRGIIRELHLLTIKPTLFVANVAEDGFDPATNKHLAALMEMAKARGDDVLAICAKIEAEMIELSHEERQEFLESLGLQESGLTRLIHAGYDLLGLATYLTAGEKEVRAWTIKKGAKAPEAAGVIHTDFQKGFIKAEVIWWEDYVELGGEGKAREAGKMRLEGKEYVVRDGDVMHFKFNV
jgi:GTP-binding protein YchF